MPIISSFFELLFDKYHLILTRSVDVVPKRNKINVTYRSINDNVPNTRLLNSKTYKTYNTGDSIEDDLRNNLVDTILSIILLSIIFCYLIRTGLTPDLQ